MALLAVLSSMKGRPLSQCLKFLTDSLIALFLSHLADIPLSLVTLVKEHWANFWTISPSYLLLRWEIPKSTSTFVTCLSLPTSLNPSLSLRPLPIHPLRWVGDLTSPFSHSGEPTFSLFPSLPGLMALLLHRRRTPGVPLHWHAWWWPWPRSGRLGVGQPVDLVRLLSSPLYPHPTTPPLC